jgi:hypothetical protein
VFIRRPVVTCIAFVFASVLVRAATGAEWQPKAAPLMTRWAADVSPDSVHCEYPRPQMVREQWLNLNAVWDYAIRPKDEPRPQQFDGQILVPFPVESALSGVMQRVDEKQRVWYRRTFAISSEWSGKRVLLNFGGADWETTVSVNGKECGMHRGGYDPFTFDITDKLVPTGPQEVVVSVFDPTDAGTQPRGKQVLKPQGIWYTPTTGIWQTVWLEPVGVSRIDGLTITADADRATVTVAIDKRHVVETFRGSHVLEATVLCGGCEVATATSPSDRLSAQLAIPDARLWSPDDPFLYDLRLRLIWRDGAERKLIDEVTSYFGLRKISLGKDEAGITRLCLNNKPLFMFGPLDQGFWPDGLYTAPTDEALRYDIEMTKKLGFNAARKHVKVKLLPLIAEPGLSAANYTQISDVEVEVNGLMTYDRALVKMDAECITSANRKACLPPVRSETPKHRRRVLSGPLSGLLIQSGRP